MPQTCPKCQRANPAEALYCYQDGFALGGRNGHAGPVDPGVMPFPMPFVFPDGTVCRNFDQLALACCNEWATAVELLRHGDFANFLAGLGRADLAKVAREAARESDMDRALDRLLGELPAKTVEPAKLYVETLQINLGQLTVGKDHRWELHLANQGMRMLSGSVAVEDGAWLTLGDGGGSPRKVFQFHSGATIPVQIRGKLLRAAAKPIQGRLVVEANGGSAVVIVTAEVPVMPFPEGALAGAVTPRQVAEKAKAAPKAAAPLFENGTVARWYIQNGWTYPVQGPAASGIGAVQQFFEALGLTKPPKVEVRESSLIFEGRPGGGVTHTLDVLTAEKRPVFASAVSDAPWLKVSKVALDGNTAHVRLAVESVPDRPGETLQANLTVRANGNQRFTVPVSLRVAGKPRTTTARRNEGIFPALEVVEVPDPRGSPAPRPRAPEPPARPWKPVDTMQAKGPGRGPVTLEAIPLDDDEDDREAPRKRSRTRAPLVLALLPVGFILFGLMVTFGRDVIWLITHPVGAVEEMGPLAAGSLTPLIGVQFHDVGEPVTVGTVGMKPEGGANDAGEVATWEPSMRFGLVTTPDADPQGHTAKRLTFTENGLTNNTVVRLDNDELIFGETGAVVASNGQRVQSYRGRWKEMDADLGTDALGVQRSGKRSVWSYDREKVDVTQTVELVPGAQSGQLDTCLVRYRIDNNDGRPHKVGLRFLLDTFIGANDGVPFLIPGQTQLCTTHLDVRGADVPLYIQAFEFDKVEQPGTIARLQFVLGGGLESPGRVSLCAWPSVDLGKRMLDVRCKQQATMWEVPVYDISTLKDSAVVMYWEPKEVGPGKSREVGFAYGLGDVAAGEGGGKLGLTAGGDFTPGGEFNVTAYVTNPTPGQTVTLTLPGGFQVSDGSDLTRPVPPLDLTSASRMSPVTWKVKAGSAGDYTLKVDSSNGASQSKKIAIKTRTLFGGN